MGVYPLLPLSRIFDSLVFLPIRLKHCEPLMRNVISWYNKTGPSRLLALALRLFLLTILERIFLLDDLLDGVPRNVFVIISLPPLILGIALVKRLVDGDDFFLLCKLLSDLQGSFFGDTIYRPFRRPCL